MDTSNGRIYTPKEMKELRRLIKKDMPNRADRLERFKEMNVDPTPVQLARKPPRVGRNEPCPCGSGKKFKRCCFTG